jgi:DNA-binding MarR family transcriptional regulator
MPPLRFDPIREAARNWRQHWGARTAPPVAAVTSLMRAHQIVLARLNEALAPHDLTFPRYEALMLVFYSRAGELPIGKMAPRLQLHQSTVTPLIDALVARGLIERVPHPTDRRATLARITDRGRAVAEAATADVNGIGFGTAPLTRAEVDGLVATLAKVRREAGDPVD